MAVVCQEQQGSQTYDYSDGKVTASRTFKVWDDAGTLSSPNAVRALFGTGTTPDAMPTRGSLFPSETGIYAQSYSIRKEAGAFEWTVVWNYSNITITSSPQPSEVGYVEWTTDIVAQFVEQFVENPTYPADGTVSASEDQNLITGGIQRDIMGNPVSLLRYTTEIVISENFEVTSGLPAAITVWRSARGKRNNATWEGAPKGTVVYKGASIRRIGINLFQVTHRLEEATDYHLVQYAERDATGTIPTAPINGRERAKKVLWRQPFPQFFDFATLSANW